MLRRGVIAIATVLLTGCIAEHFQNNMNEGLHQMVGLNIKTAVDLWGYPTAHQEILGDDVYTWAYSRQSSLTLPTVDTTTGTVNGDTFSATTYGTEVITMQAECRIDLIVDKDLLITKYRWEGNLRGCERFLPRD